MFKLEVSTHSGEVDIVTVEVYEPKTLTDSLNNNEIQSISLGDNIYSRIDIKNIKLISE